MNPETVSCESPRLLLLRMDWKERTTTFLPDPLNPRIYTFRDDPEDPDLADYRASILELPDAPAQEWAQPNPSVARGKVCMERFEGAILENKRRVWIYTPVLATCAASRTMRSPMQSART